MSGTHGIRLRFVYRLGQDKDFYLLIISFIKT